MTTTPLPTPVSPDASVVASPALAEIDWPARLRRFAGCGALAAALIAFHPQFGFGSVAFFFLLAPLIVVPAGLVPVMRRERSPLIRLAAGLQPVGAAAAVGSFALEPGPAAAGLALPWAGVIALLGFAGLGRLLRGAVRTVDDLCVTAALLYVPIGGAWFVQSRAGLELLGFREPIILLTGVHFHFTAFAAVMIAAEIGRELPAVDPRGALRGVHAAAALGLIAGTPLLAAGFTASPVLKVAAAATIVLSVSLLGVLQLLALPALPGPAARTAAAVSSLAAGGGMAAAFVYELGEFTGRPMLTIPDMVLLHGPAMGLGFVLCGLAARVVFHQERGRS